MDIPGRFGGEEFGILLPDTDLKEAMIIAERLREKISNTVFSFDDKVRITVSMGASRLAETIENSHKWIDAADQALYRAKESGRNRLILA